MDHHPLKTTKLSCDTIGYDGDGSDTSLQRSYDCHAHAIVDTSKVITNYRVFFHFTAPEAGGKPKPYTQQSNRDREWFVPPAEEEDGVVMLP